MLTFNQSFRNDKVIFMNYLASADGGANKSQDQDHFKINHFEELLNNASGKKVVG